jgi:hypothetical protein
MGVTARQVAGAALGLGLAFGLGLLAGRGLPPSPAGPAPSSSAWLSVGGFELEHPATWTALPTERDDEGEVPIDTATLVAPEGSLIVVQVYGGAVPIDVAGYAREVAEATEARASADPAPGLESPQATSFEAPLLGALRPAHHLRWRSRASAAPTPTALEVRAASLPGHTVVLLSVGAEADRAGLRPGLEQVASSLRPDRRRAEARLTTR